MKEIKIEESARIQVAEFLPCAIKKAFASYHIFMGGEPDDSEAKKFKEQHNAGKAALAHIALLLDLAGRVHVDMDALSQEDPELKESMANYQKHLDHDMVPEQA